MCGGHSNHNKLQTMACSAVLGLALMLPVASSVLAQALPPPAQETLLMALDDERKAENLYKAIMVKFGDERPFSNIIKAEQQHQNMLLNLMAHYKVAVPANPYVTKDAAKDIASIGQACQQGVAAEIANVALYKDRLLPAVKDYSNITAVFVRLQQASQNNHLSAFRRCAARRA